MEYLTVHDLVWINNTVTGKINRYDYVTLEAAMAGQYRYGDSQEVPMQAAQLLERLLFRAPFENGNRRTAFIATLTFLNANGYATLANDSEAVQTLQRVERCELTPRAAMLALAAPAKDPLPADLTLRKLITLECNLHTEALKALAEQDG
jgi:death-on-curing protein